MAPEIISMAKRFVPTTIKRLLKRSLNFLSDIRLNRSQKKLRELQRADYSSLELADSTKSSISLVQSNAEAVLGPDWNYYSNALRREVVYVFERSIKYLLRSFKTIDYLEIGSAQGLSMSIIGQLLMNEGALGRLVSIDPYFPAGYPEGALGIWGKRESININKETRDNAYTLYDRIGIGVDHIEDTSSSALTRLICDRQAFHLIYIDGSHEGFNPLTDFGFSLQVLIEKGVIMLDDHYWPDVNVIKKLCDRYCRALEVSWKVASYEVPT